MFNSFGQYFRFTTFGESHGPGIGVVVDGVPAGLPLEVEELTTALLRRRPGQSIYTTSRKEEDSPEILSGWKNGITLGSPLTVWVKNKDVRSSDYDALEKLYRPSHADYTYQQKYGIRDAAGGGRASARETIGRVVAGVVAQKWIQQEYPVNVWSWVSSVGDISLPVDYIPKQWSDIESSSIRCPEAEISRKMEELILSAKEKGDTVGGCISGYIEGVPVGWGEPMYMKIQALLGYALLSIPAVKGIEFGSGFSGSQMKGSQHNDIFYTDNEGRIRTQTNHSGGIQGGITNGEPIIFRIAFKPVSTILSAQETVSLDGEKVEMKAKGRHDSCVLPRAVPIVEAMTWCVLADLRVLASQRFLVEKGNC